MPAPLLASHGRAPGACLSLWLQVSADALREACGDADGVDGAPFEPAAPAEAAAAPPPLPPAPGLLLPVLRTLRALLGTPSAPPEEATVADVLPTLLRLLGPLAGEQSPDSPPIAADERMALLEAAIDCARACALLLPYASLYPYRRKVLLALQRPLDHKKRRVRRAAARCANQWHALAGAS